MEQKKVDIIFDSEHHLNLAPIGSIRQQIKKHYEYGHNKILYQMPFEVPIDDVLVLNKIQFELSEYWIKNESIKSLTNVNTNIHYPSSSSVLEEKIHQIFFHEFPHLKFLARNNNYASPCICQKGKEISIQREFYTSFYCKDLINLNNQILTLQSSLESLFNINKMVICGGSARAILDYIYYKKPLNMRDLDIVLVLPQNFDENYIRHIANFLEEQNVGNFLTNSFDSRLRKLPSQPNEDPLYNAGYGFYLVSDSGPILDLSFFKKESDIELNGLMDIDTVKIVLEKNESLIHFIEESRKKTLNDSILEGKVIDPHHGYLSWVGGNPTIIRWDEIERDPHLHILRLIRGYMKMNLNSFSANLSKILKDLCLRVSLKQTRRLSQYLLKILDDDLAYKELKLSQKLGVFQNWLPELNIWLEKVSYKDLAALLTSRQMNAVEKLKVLILQIPSEKQAETFFISIYKFDLEIAMEITLELMLNSLTVNRNFFKVCLVISEVEREKFENQVLKIISNDSLDNVEKCAFIIWGLFQAQKSNNLIKE